MKAWAVTLLLSAVIGGVASYFLPEGDKSPLYRPFRLITALTVLLILCQPLLSLARYPEAIKAGDFAKADEAYQYDPGKILLKQSEKSIEEKIRAAFPEGGYEIEFITDEEEQSILSIRVVSDDKILAQRITDYLTDNQMAVR